MGYILVGSRTSCSTVSVGLTITATQPNFICLPAIHARIERANSRLAPETIRRSDALATTRQRICLGDSEPALVAPEYHIPASWHRYRDGCDAEPVSRRTVLTYGSGTADTGRDANDRSGAPFFSGYAHFLRRDQTDSTQ